MKIFCAVKAESIEGCSMLSYAPIFLSRTSGTSCVYQSRKFTSI